METKEERNALKDNEKKVGATEQAKKETKPEENVAKLTEEELEQVAGGINRRR